MRTRHPLFEFSPLGDAWDGVATLRPFSADQRDALHTLACNKDKLPAPVFFTLPDGAEGDERWQQIITASQPQCKCVSRRLLLPTRGRARFVPHTTPHLATLALTPSDLVYRTAPCYVVPHGGDAAAAYVGLSFNYNRLLARENPLCHVATVGPTMFYGRQSTAPHLQGTMEFDLLELNRLVKAFGEVVCFSSRGYGPDQLVFPVCSIVGVTLPNRDKSESVTVEFDASVKMMTLPFDPHTPPERHECPPSV